jgi:hypothetical protein
MRVYSIYDYIQYGLDVFVLTVHLILLGGLIYFIGKSIFSTKPQK